MALSSVLQVGLPPAPPRTIAILWPTDVFTNWYGTQVETMTVPPYGVWWSMELGFASDGTVRWRTNSTTWDEWSERQFWQPPDPMNPADAEAYKLEQP